MEFGFEALGFKFSVMPFFTVRLWDKILIVVQFALSSLRDYILT